MKKVAITGATGAIGRALRAGLEGVYELQPMSRSLDGTDLRDAAGLEARFAGCDAVVHLAWAYARDGQNTGSKSMANVLMHQNVLLAAKAAKVPRLVMASSVHADFFYDWMGPGLLGVDRQQRANGIYGGLKLLCEALGREHADEATRIVDVRYGGVTGDGSPHRTDNWEQRVWLSHPDLCAMARAVVDHPAPPVYSLFYAVSANDHRVHDTTNPFGWEPKDAADADIRAELSP